MKLLSASMILVCAAAAADTAIPMFPSEAEGNAVVERWRRAQEDGDFAAYQALYADPFTGIRRSGTRKATFDRAGWIKDRERMFKKKMTVTVANLKVAKSADGLIARFEQTWESGNYRDVGWKELLLLRQGEEVKIAREEQLGSRRLGQRGAPTWVVWPARAGDAPGAADAELAQLTGELKMLRHGDAHPRTVDGVGLVIAACAEAELEPVVSTFQALQPRVESRPAPASTQPACPTLEVNPDTQTGWSWPEIKTQRLGKQTLTLLAWQRDEDEAGDFARNYKETKYVAVLRGADGALLDVATAGSPDFSWFTSVDAEASGFAVREEFVDEACDGLHAHRQRHYEHQERFTVHANKIQIKESRKTLLSTITCGDDEKRYYK